MRLIDAKELERQTKEAFKESPVVMGMLLRWIRKQSTIDPESLRKKGEWRFCKDEGHMLAECHLCGYVAEGFQAALWDFCPNCGADMRGDTDAAD